MILGAAAVAAAGLLFVASSPPSQPAAPATPAFPQCLRTLQCANVEEFDGIPFQEMVTISRNYDRCFEDYKIEQTCKVQVSQDIERYWELGYVAER